MDRPLLQIVTILLFSALLMASAGTIFFCVAAHAPAVGCHHSPVPSNPQPSDYRCCVAGYRTALLNRIFSPRPAVQAVKLAAMTHVSVASDSNASPVASVRSGGPPGTLILRI